MAVDFIVMAPDTGSLAPVFSALLTFRSTPIWHMQTWMNTRMLDGGYTYP